MSQFKFPYQSFKKKPVSGIPKGSWVGKKETITGELERIVYQNEENHFTIARVRKDRDQVTIVGNLFGVNVGETLQITGEWTNHKKFGFQFTVESFLTLTPSTLNGIEKYLGSGLIKGIGPVMAKRLVEKFGDNTLDVIEGRIESLKQVEGIGAKRIEMISAAWKEQKDVRDVMIFLQTHGVSPAYAMKIYKKYGKRSVSVVTENPYRLATDIFGIGFKIADEIAGKLGIDPKSPHRLASGVLYALRVQTDKGHLFCTQEMLIKEGMKLLNAEEELILQALNDLKADRQIVIEEIDTEEGRAIAVYTMPAYIAESEIALSLLKLRDVPRKEELQVAIDPGEMIRSLERDMRIAYSEAQKEVIKTAFAGERVMVITGGPGTGKTTIIKSLVRLFADKKLNVLLAAPTGRAAKRMTETTGLEAKTIHRLLEFNVKKGGFVRDAAMPLETDVAIIDETSMIDTFLMFSLLRAITPGTALVLIGDKDQLPSVGPGNVLKDIINSDAVTVVFLNKIFRQKHQGLLVSNAHRINRGELPIFPVNEKGGDFFFFKSEKSEDSMNWVIDLVKDRIPGKFHGITREDIQVITPMNRGILGTLNLNGELQAALNPNGKEIVKAGKTFRVGDRVMQLRNNYDKLVFNGDMGVVTDINMEDQELGVRIDDVRIVYGFDELDQLDLAYAITVHKSQGSEYEAVVLPMATEHYLLLQRNLFYTGVTRAKKLLVIVGSKRAMWIALKNDKSRTRFTHLSERLKQGQAMA